MTSIAAIWDQLIDCICRPPREQYEVADLIGGVKGEFKVGRAKAVREDVVVRNKQGQNLQGSFYRLADVTGAGGKLPCVIYCHCNSGSRREAEEAVWLLLPQSITVFAFDFAGSGLSDGEWVTLGAKEVDDLECVVNYLRQRGETSTIALWGRSMGAVTSLLYSHRDPSIAGMVLDSPFARLTDLMMELVKEQKIPVPRMFMRGALAIMRRSVRKRAGFDIYDVAPIDFVNKSFIPALFGHSDEDTFVRKHHSEMLYQSYAGDKNFITFSGDHNSYRPAFFYDSATIFLHNVLQMSLQQLEPRAEPLRGGTVQSAPAAEPSPLSALLRHDGGTDVAALQETTGSPHPRTAGATQPPWRLPQHQSQRSNDEDEALVRMMERAQHEESAQLAGDNDGADVDALQGALNEEQMMLQQAIAASLSDSLTPASQQQQQQQSAADARENANAVSAVSQQYLADVDYDDEEQLRRAIEESLKLVNDQKQQLEADVADKSKLEAGHHKESDQHTSSHDKQQTDPHAAASRSNDSSPQKQQAKQQTPPRDGIGKDLLDL